MISVPNRATWESKFNSIRPLYDCDVKFYYEDTSVTPSVDVLILNKQHITNFSITSRNCYVCEEAPNVEGSLEILDWNNLSSTIKNILLTYHQWLKLKYVVDNTETTGFLWLYIDKCTISRKGTAKLILKSAYSLGSPKYDGKVWGMIQHHPIIDPSEWVDYATNYVKMIDDTGAMLYKKADSLTMSLTECEAYQNFALVTRTGIKYNGTDTDFDWDNISQVTYSPAVATGNYNFLNVTDYELIEDDSNKKNINIYGFEEKEAVQLASVEAPSYAEQLNNGIIYYFDEPTVITNYQAYKNGQGYINGNYHLVVMSDRAIAVKNTTEITGADVIFYFGYKTDVAKADNDIPYIQTFVFSNTSTAKTQAQTYCRGYFGSTKLIEAECRIDPTIEPLDIIATTLNGSLIHIVLEEVVINFNGGFTGSIKGRIAKLPSSISVSNQKTDFEINEAFSFGGTVTCTSSYGDTSDVTSQCTFSGYDMTQTGTQTVTVSYTSGSITLTTTYQITVSAVKSPVLVDYELNTSDDWYFEIANPNNMAKTLKVAYSGGTLTFNIAGKSQLIIDPTNASQLDGSVNEYIYRSLFDDVYCYFNEGGNNLLLLEANG